MTHSETWDLIPWLVNGRAQGAERQLAEAHLRDCEACRTELDIQRRLQAAMSQEAGLDLLPAASLQRLHARLDAQAAPADARPQRAARSRSMLRWLVAAVVVESIGLMFLSAALWREDVSSAPYRTVTSAMQATASSASIRAVFSPQLPVQELQTLLETSHLKIVAGPSEAGVYSLALLSSTGPAAIESALATLRAHPGVRFAEPIAAEQR